MVHISNNTLPNLQSLANSSSVQNASLLKIGQTLNANITQIQGKQIHINLGDQTLIATSKDSLQKLGPIQVQVRQLQPTLELVIIKQPNNTAAQQLQQILQTAYRQHIPNQQGISQALQQISLIQALPPSLAGPVNQLLEQVTKSNIPLSGKDLKNKIGNSGLFMESKIAKGDKNNLNSDVKAQLLKLNHQTETLNTKKFSPQLAQLAGTLVQAINRLTVQQLQLFENPYITALELPFKSDRTINETSIEFRKHKKAQPPFWEVLIDISLPAGEMSAKLILKDQMELNCLIWCETDELEQLVAEQLSQLEEQLRSCLTLNNLMIVNKKPTKSEQTTQIALIDIHI